MLTGNQLDYTYNFYKKPNEEASVKETKGNQYNPYVNNSGTVMGKQ
jgi:hypothetical protein